MGESLAGKLLVATPDLLDGNFFRTVVLVIEHDDVEGAVGLVLNRRSDAMVADYLPDWASAMEEPALVHIGGPVTPEVAIGLAEAPREVPEGWRPVLGGIGIIDLSAHPDTFGGLSRVRVFAGYSGWEVGQLEAELVLRSWFVLEAHPDDAFCNEPETLWRSVLRRQPGTLAWYANYPIDPLLN